MLQSQPVQQSMSGQISTNVTFQKHAGPDLSIYTAVSMSFVWRLSFASVASPSAVYLMSDLN